MIVPLHRHPNLDYLKKQAKQLHSAHKNGKSESCQFLRRLKRFSDASDEEILTANVTLADTQFVVALFYGFDSWAKLRAELQSYPYSQENSLDAVKRRNGHKIPEYAGAGVPLGVVCALNHEGVDIDFSEFAAATGWAFSFGYTYDDVSPAYMGVRGNPSNDGPFEVFAFLPQLLGFDYEMEITAEPDRLWDFVKQRVDAGTPIMSEQLDGGLITAYREKDSKRQIFFDGTVMPGWKDADKLNPYAVYSLVKSGKALPAEEIRVLALRRAVAKGQARSWENIPQGLTALRAYLADVADVTKDFSSTEEWFCWATFERLMARKCCELWLRSCVDHLESDAGSLVREAADRYGEAFRLYDQYRAAIQDGYPPGVSLMDRARTPDRIAAIAPILKEGIKAESAGLSSLSDAVEMI